MELKDIRCEIDKIDEELVKLFCRRMDIAADVAACKKEMGLPVYDPARERDKLCGVADAAGEENRTAVCALYELLFELSRAKQDGILCPASELERAIAAARESTPELFPARAQVACMGVEGAYAQIACEKLFSLPGIVYCRNFKSVLAAVRDGLCRYGVLPIENSTAGSVKEVADLVAESGMYIVRSVRLKVDHCLVAKKGCTLSGIREIYSHPQAIAQCDHFLHGLKDVRITPCENTAMAARMVAEPERKDVAALSSANCAGLYGLAVLQDDVQDRANNYTRFVCISKELEIYPGADRTSIMLALPNKPGALYRVLARFSALGVNMVKLESRPVPERDFEFVFYLDLDKPVVAPELTALLRELSGSCREFRYLGSYSEMNG
ncbi:MAG: prephenate dehydratase [Clostridia bacterium]|nr:prephenate dehydratase [Clostridia bacterium]